MPPGYNSSISLFGPKMLCNTFGQIVTSIYNFQRSEPKHTINFAKIHLYRFCYTLTSHSKDQFRLINNHTLLFRNREEAETIHCGCGRDHIYLVRWFGCPVYFSKRKTFYIQFLRFGFQCVCVCVAFVYGVNMNERQCEHVKVGNNKSVEQTKLKPYK